MRSTILLILSALVLPGSLAMRAPIDSVSFTPEAGVSLTKSFKTTNQFALDDLSMSMNGQPFPMEMEMEMDMALERAIVVTDEFAAMGAGRPSKLRRSFDEITSAGTFSMEMAMMGTGPQEKTLGASSELEGKTVIFTWNEESGEFDRSYDGDGDTELLEKLEEDMDLRALLPEGEVSEGDTWQIEPKRLATLLMPGGDLALVPELDGEDLEMGGMPGMDSMGDFSQMIGDFLEGEATAEYKGTREVDGVKVGVIALTMNISSSNDITETVMEAIADSVPDEVGEMEVDHVDVEIEIEGEGVLFWNLAGGFLHSFELNATMSMLTDMGMSVSMGDQSMDIEQTIEMSGDLVMQVTATKN